MKQAVILITALLFSTVAFADEKISLSTETTADDGVPRRRTTGLSVFASAGTVWADDCNANFYSGRPQNANTINRVLYSNSYGTRIWTDLKNDGLIDGTIGSYNQLKVEEYANMYYRLSYQIGLGIRYDYASGFGWLLRFDLMRLTANGVFNLGSSTGTGILTNNHRYIPCDIMGREDRINIDLALTRTVDLGDNICLELDLGAHLNNAKVKENVMVIDGSSYSILDVWGGNTPDVGVGDYEYINQGGLGWGVFISGLVGYQMESIGAIKLGYTCYHSMVNLKGYEGMGWHHSLFLRFEINNFSFL